jgi:cytidylate kinase
MGIITVSRMYGSGGTVLAQEIAKRMGYTYVADRSFINRICEVRWTQASEADLEDELAPTLYERIEELMSNRSLYRVNLMLNVYEQALRDNVVFVGLGTHIILEGIPNVINIQAVQRLSERVRAVANTKNISLDNALALINKMESQRKKFINHYFEKNLTDPTLYHLILNASYVTLEDAVDIVSGYAKKYCSPEGTAEAGRILRNRLLEKRAEMLLFRLNMVHNFGKIVFEAKEEGVLLVKGIVGGEGEKTKLLEALEQLEDVKKIEDHLKKGILSRNLY